MTLRTFAFPFGVLVGALIARVSPFVIAFFSRNRFLKKWASIVRPEHVQTRQMRRAFARGVSRAMVRQAKAEHEKR